MMYIDDITHNSPFDKKTKEKLNKAKLTKFEMDSIFNPWINE